MPRWARGSSEQEGPRGAQDRVPAMLTVVPHGCIRRDLSQNAFFTTTDSDGYNSGGTLSVCSTYTGIATYTQVPFATSVTCTQLTTSQPTVTTTSPTRSPSTTPTQRPSVLPTLVPSLAPSFRPTASPSEPTKSPTTSPTTSPTRSSTAVYRVSTSNALNNALAGHALPYTHSELERGDVSTLAFWFQQGRHAP